MLKNSLLLCLLALAPWVWGSEPHFEQDKTSLIGLHQMEDDVLLVLEHANKDSVWLQMVSSSRQHDWCTALHVDRLKGYHFNRVQMLHNPTEIFWVSQLDASVTYTKVDRKDGSVLSVENEINMDLNEDSPLVWCGLDSNDLCFYKREDSVVLQQSHQDWTYSSWVSMVTIPNAFTQNHFQYITTQDQQWISATYNLASDHSKMQLMLMKRDLSTGDYEEKMHEMTLDQTSYTYNSSVDNKVLYFKAGANGFYAMGKLDHAYKGNYPQRKVGEGFIGFWMAKFNTDLELVYFSQFPFQIFRGLVTNDGITKPAVIDIKEDPAGGLFININERKEVLYGKKYVIYLDSTGTYRSVVGGQDAYNFFEYEGNGLRKAGRAANLRLMNDDWGYISSSYLHMMQYATNRHPAVLKEINELSEALNLPPSRMAYNYWYSDQYLYVGEFLDKKKGTLRIYRFAR